MLIISRSLTRKANNAFPKISDQCVGVFLPQGKAIIEGEAGNNY